MSKQNHFPKSERLCGEIRINKLFSEGKSFIAYPYRIVFFTTDELSDAAVKVLISVPKRKFKNATDRNRIKRQMREAYRLNKHDLYAICAANDCCLQIGISYIANEKSDFKLINNKMKIALHKVSELIHP